VWHQRSKGDAHAVRRIARIECFPDLTKNAYDRDRCTLAAVNRDHPPKHEIRWCGVDPDILASSADHDCAIVRALNRAGHAPGREALHHELTSEIDRSLAHGAAPSRIFCAILRLRYRPSCGLAKYWPLRTITLPRRIVTTGQAKMSWPSHGV